MPRSERKSNQRADNRKTQELREQGLPVKKHSVWVSELVHQVLECCNAENQQHKMWQVAQGAPAATVARSPADQPTSSVDASPFGETDNVRIFGEGGCFRKLLTATAYRWFYTYNKLNSLDEQKRYEAQVKLLFAIEGGNPLFHWKCLKKGHQPESRKSLQQGLTPFSPEEYKNNTHPRLLDFFAVEHLVPADGATDASKKSGHVDVLGNSATKKYKPEFLASMKVIAQMDITKMHIDMEKFGEDALEDSNVAAPLLKYAVPLIAQIYISLIGRKCIQEDASVKAQNGGILMFFGKSHSSIQSALSETSLWWLEFVIRSLHLQRQQDIEHTSHCFEALNNDFEYFCELGLNFEGLRQHESLKWNLEGILTVFHQTDPITNEQKIMLIQMAKQLSNAVDLLPLVLGMMREYSPWVHAGQKLLKNLSSERKAAP